jgi:hypothetical protein
MVNEKCIKILSLHFSSELWTHGWVFNGRCCFFWFREIIGCLHWGFENSIPLFGEAMLYSTRSSHRGYFGDLWESHRVGLSGTQHAHYSRVTFGCWHTLTSRSKWVRESSIEHLRWWLGHLYWILRATSKTLIKIHGFISTHLHLCANILILDNNWRSQIALFCIVYKGTLLRLEIVCGKELLRKHLAKILIIYIIWILDS